MDTFGDINGPGIPAQEIRYLLWRLDPTDKWGAEPPAGTDLHSQQRRLALDDVVVVPKTARSGIHDAAFDYARVLDNYSVERLRYYVGGPKPTE